MTLKFLDKLSKDFTELLSDKEDYNLIIEVDKESNRKSFTAHSAVLRYRSTYFRKELAKIATDENRIRTLVRPNISAGIFEVILKYTYGGVIDLENADNKFIFDLMISSDELEFDELSEKLEIYLIEDKASWLRTHFSLVYHSVFNENSHFKNLEKFCNDIIAKYPNLIFDTEDFTSIKEPALISLLKRDDLRMEEIKIWDKVIQWGIAQNSALPLETDKWSKENFVSLKRTLQQCLPHIRYFQLSGEDVMDKLEPYKKILEKQLWRDIMTRLAIPNRQIKSIILPARSVVIPELTKRITKSFSTIINDNHAAEISSWIDRKSTYSTLNIPYEFQLILRGSRDGFDPQTFLDMSHGHTCTVIVMKVEGTDEILGGYNPLTWNKTLTTNSYINTNDSFIFSLKNNSIQNSILSRVKMASSAFYYRDQRFGYSFGQNDLWFLKGPRVCYCCTSVCYEHPIRTVGGIFNITDYEVFEVVKKTI